MIPPELLALAGTAATIGVLHTLLGPDHYVPFIAMARAGMWSRTKSLVVTMLSGIGHVGGSVLIGTIGIALGTGLGHLSWIESARGEIAAWLLVAFGLVYVVWGLRRSLRSHPHTHHHAHSDGTVHAHTHTHEQAHIHPHAAPGTTRLTPWVLFTIFVFGPCEPLIPVLMYPAAVHSVTGVILVAGIFAVATIGTMVGMVLLGLAGVRLLPMAALERYMHPVAGIVVALSGAAILVLGL